MLRVVSARGLYIAQCRLKHGRPLRKALPKVEGVTPLLSAKIKQWKDMYKLETEARANNDAYVIKDLLFRDFVSHPAHGDILQLYLPADAKARYENHLSSGVKVALVVNDCNISCVCTALDDNVVSLRLLSNITIEDLRQNNLKLAFGKEMAEPPVDMIETFWSENKNWDTLPGYKNLLMAYRASPLQISYEKGRKLKPLSQGLNKAQISAVAKALDSKQPLLCIQGPPGTGKTAVVTEIILQLRRRKKKVLVVAPSNRAVDNVYERIRAAIESNGQHLILSMKGGGETSLQKAMEDHPAFAELKDLCSQINDYFESDLDNFYNKATLSAQQKRKAIRGEVLNDAHVIYTTLTSATLSRIRNSDIQPDVVIIDEGGQALEASSWHAVMLAPKAIIVGDHCQLGPPISHLENLKNPELCRSIMDHLSKDFGDSLKVLLREQYRSHDLIMQWPNQEFYEEKLVAAESVGSITLKDIIEVPAHLVADPMVLVDTAGAGIRFSEQKYRHSYRNEGEAEVVVQQVKDLLAAGLEPQKIGVIAPYVGQVRLISSMLDQHPDVAVHSVDGFQGDEREVICMSLVRSRPRGVKTALGFLNDLRRMNVSVTRARRQFFLVANSDTLASEPSLNNLLTHFRTNCRVIHQKDAHTKVLKKANRR